MNPESEIPTSNTEPKTARLGSADHRRSLVSKEVSRAILKGDRRAVSMWPPRS